MSNSSAASSTTKNVQPNGRVKGVPKRCWCGEHIVAKISKSDNNPYRRYYRCYYAVVHKIANDNHTFKWVDEALFDEIESLGYKITRLEKEVEETHRFLSETMEIEKKVFQEMGRKIETQLGERIDNELFEAKSFMKKMMAVLVGCCVIILCLIKFMKI